MKLETFLKVTSREGIDQGTALKVWPFIDFKESNDADDEDILRVALRKVLNRPNIKVALLRMGNECFSAH